MKDKNEIIHSMIGSISVYLEDKDEMINLFTDEEKVKALKRIFKEFREEMRGYYEEG